MKTSRWNELFRPRLTILSLVGILSVATLPQLASAQQAQAEGVGVPAAPPQAPVSAAAASQGNASAPVQRTTATLSPGVADILKMASAGVSAEVLKAYVQNAALAFRPSPADLIALKEQGIPDDITTVLLKRSAEVKAGPGQGTPTSGAPAVAVNRPGSSFLDPEGYDYFRYYYLYPRTLASVYQRLPYYPVPFNYGPPSAFQNVP